MAERNLNRKITRLVKDFDRTVRYVKLSLEADPTAPGHVCVWAEVDRPGESTHKNCGSIALPIDIVDIPSEMEKLAVKALLS